jgi:hypothetical protein
LVLFVEDEPSIFEPFSAALTRSTPTPARRLIPDSRAAKISVTFTEI